MTAQSSSFVKEDEKTREDHRQTPHPHDNFNFGESGGQLQSFDDGHIPENFLLNDQNDTNYSTKLVHYPHFFDPPARVQVFWDQFPEALVDHFYERTVRIQRESKTPWGSYVTIEQVQAYWKKHQEQSASNDSQSILSGKNDDNTSDQELEIRLVAAFLALALGEKGAPNQCLTEEESQKDDPLWTISDLERAHGVAIWALAASPGSQVPYHLDYAEQIRYETNIIVPPLLAGTCHCTRAKIQGGAFQVSLDGLEHYQRHGYKVKTKSLEGDLIDAPYRYNQVICHAGHLPHASSRIESISPLDENLNTGENLLRVIIGFNVFAPDIGPLVQHAPEHSDAFRRKVQVQRKLQQFPMAKSLNLQSIQQNKPLSKLLVLAKREKVKNDFRMAKERLETSIPGMLPTTVQNLMDKLASKDGSSWPNPVDVQVHIHHKVLQGSFNVINDEQGDIASSEQTKNDLISPAAVVGLRADQ
jgi:hypothetical protein